MSYRKPEDVKSPKKRWIIKEVIIKGTAGECAYAVGLWDGRARIAFRWNGTDENPLGMPQSRGYPTWIVLDPKLYDIIISYLSDEEKNKVKLFLAKGEWHAKV